jgi:hypothetical protein
VPDGLRSFQDSRACVSVALLQFLHGGGWGTDTAESNTKAQLGLERVETPTLWLSQLPWRNSGSIPDSRNLRTLGTSRSHSLFLN